MSNISSSGRNCLQRDGEDTPQSSQQDREKAVRKMHTEFEHAWAVSQNRRDIDGDGPLAQAAFEGDVFSFGWWMIFGAVAEQYLFTL